jgi:pilus assembly protein CpaB
VLGFGLSVVIATSVVAPLSLYLRGKEAELAEVTGGAVVVTLPTATRVLGPGTILAAADLALLELAPPYVPDGVALNVEDLVGRTVTERLLPGEAIRMARLAPRDAQSGLAALVGEGSRAVSLEVSNGEKVSGFIEPGDQVDVLVTFLKERQVPAETVMLGENVRVLAVDHVMSETAEGEPIEKQRVTLALNPVDAERLVHAAEVGKPRLALRAMADNGITPIAGVAPPPRLGSLTYSVKEWREKVSPGQYAAMVSRLERHTAPKPLPVDPHLLRTTLHP